MRSWKIITTRLSILVIIIFCFPFCRSEGIASNTDSLNVSYPEGGVDQKDIDGDGIPDIISIEGNFASDNDQIIVLDTSGDMKWSPDWSEVVDFENDIWIFDAFHDGLAELIIIFRKDGDKLLADMYKDVDEDSHVSYELENKKLTITESDYWSLQVQTTKNWFKDITQPYEMVFSLDGPSDAVWYWAESVQQRFLKTDGNVDWVCKVEESSDNNDFRHLEICNTRVNLPSSWTIVRSFIKVSLSEKTAQQPPNYVFWPLLVSSNNFKLEDHKYFDYKPLIIMDWEASEFIRYGISGYPVENGFHVQSFTNLDVEGVVNLDFESPQAYYDLAEDQDNQPELHIRLSNSWPIKYENHWQQAPKVPVNEIRYSWNQTNSPGMSWDYKLGLAGSLAIDTQENFSGYTVSLIPYDELPSWVKTNIWNYGTFVANEEIDDLQSSEGIYAWAPVGYGSLYNNLALLEGNIFDPQAVENFTLHYYGETSEELDKYFWDILPGLRGEYSFHFDREPYIYLSPVDNRLHLLGAESGMWNLGEGNYLRYANLDGDAYLDQWNQEREGKVTQQLNFSQGWGVYSGGENVIIKQVNAPPAIFETQPPGSHEEWLYLKDQLEAYPKQLAPTDFRGMLEGYSGDEMRLEGAALRDFRITREGFRFVLSLSPGFYAQGVEWLDLSAAEPGEYLVNYDGGFSVQPLRRAHIVISAALNESKAMPEIALKTGEASFRVFNDGLEDAQEVLVSMSASQGGEVVYESAPMTVTVLGGESRLVSFPWTPTLAGTWELRVVAKWGEGETVETLEKLQIRPAEGVGFGQAVSAFDLVESWQIISFWIIMIIVAVSGGGLVIRMAARDRGADRKFRR